MSKVSIEFVGANGEKLSISKGDYISQDKFNAFLESAAKFVSENAVSPDDAAAIIRSFQLK